MGRPVHADGRQTRRAILDAALSLFAEKGYFGTSLRDIAAVVGVRESAIYNYFRGKEALFDALMTAAQERKAERLAAVIDDAVPDVRLQLEHLAAFVLEGFRGTRERRLFRVFLSDGMRLAKEGRIDFIERMTTATAPLDALMRRLVAEGALRPRRPEILITEFMGPLLLWRHWHALHPHGRLVADRHAFVRDHVDQFLQGSAMNTTTRAERMRAAKPGRASS
jgi:AcrR family transcriptional regulator